jgi:hypothetical protein
MILFINHERHLFVVAQIVFRYGPVFDQVRADQMLFHQHAALDTVYIAHQKAAVVVFFVLHGAVYLFCHRKRLIFLGAIGKAVVFYISCQPYARAYDHIFFTRFAVHQPFGHYCVPLSKALHSSLTSSRRMAAVS